MSVASLSATPISRREYLSSRFSHTSVGGVQIDNDIGLSLPIKLGTPAQDMSVLLSMGSASGLTMFGCNECGETPFYQPNRSSTWSRRENVGGPFDVAYDTIGITGLTVPNASCGESAHRPTAPLICPF